MSICFRCHHLSMSSSSRKRERRRQTKIVHALMESVATRWRPTTSFPSVIMQPIRLTRFLSSPSSGHFWNSTPRFSYLGVPSDRLSERVRFTGQEQLQWNHGRPSLPADQDQRSAAIDGEACHWPSSIPLLVALVVVVSDFLVLLALVFHLFESSSASLLPSSFVSSFPPSIDPLFLTLSPCKEVVHSLSPAPDERESCSGEPLLLPAWTSDGTLFSIWIFDSVLLCCAVLSRLIRTSSIWLRRSKFRDCSFCLNSKLNCFSQRVSDDGNKFNSRCDHVSGRDRVWANTLRPFRSDCDHVRRIRKCEVTLRDWWHWLWPSNHTHDVRLSDVFTQSLSRHRRGGLQWTCVISQWRPNCTHLDNNVGNDQLVKRRVDFRLPTSALPMLVARNATRLIFDNNKLLRNSLGRRAAALSSTPTISSSCLAIVLLLSSFSSVVVSSSTPNAPFQAVPPLGSSSAQSSSALASDRLPMTDSLNPWLAADGGLILRAAAGDTPNSSPLNWIRPNPGSCVPQPTIPACPSDRFCRLPETNSFPVSFAHPMPPNNNNSSKNGVVGYRPSDSASGRDGRQEKNSGTRGEVRRNENGVPADDDGLRNADAAVAKASQCLPYLQPGRREQSDADDDGPSSAECICGHADGAKRVDTLRKYHLHHCYHYSLWHVLSDTMREGIAISRSQCYAYLEAVERLDNLAAHFVCQFEDIIRRYDCGQTFSSKSSCHQCKVAYRQWVCSMVLPMWLDGNRVKPCRTFCHEVERLCPYFLPAEKSGPGSQYAGEPSFLCIDPDVRETTNQSTNSAYSERPCYRPCTLEYNLEPDIDPSLCVASLGDISGLMEEDGTVEADKECQQTYTNVTASISEFDVDMLDVDSEVNNDQCTPLLGKDPLSTSRLSSRGWTNNLHFVWPWRTIVLPFAMLPIIHFFT
uniref:Transmembrane protein FAM155B n=1 Tax=Daphnia magna TaxID=35525 RepID=A0A0P6CLY5_9CRUS